MNPQAPGIAWFDSAAAAAHLGFRTVKAFQKFLERRAAMGKPVRTHWLQGRKRFRRVDLDACVEVMPEVNASAPLRRVK